VRLHVRATVADGRIRGQWICSRPPVRPVTAHAPVALARP
jgi:hypothetical protein